MRFHARETFTCADLDGIRARVPAGWLILAAVALTGCGASASAAVVGQGQAVTVTHVVDGDTVHVTDPAGADITVRVIGLDSPETRRPHTPVQCGGPEATAYAKTVLLGQRVRLVADPTQDSVDRYGRSLGYLRLPDGTDYSVEAVRAGMGRAYVYDRPGLMADDIQDAEDEARAAGRGGWISCGWAA